MLRELLLSVASGVIVAVILQIFGFGRRREAVTRAPSRSARYAPPRRRSFFGRIMRLLVAVAGGIALAQSIAPFLLPRRFGVYGEYDRFDRYDDYGSLAVDAPILVLTMISTAIVYIVLSALTRR